MRSPSLLINFTATARSPGTSPLKNAQLSGSRSVLTAQSRLSPFGGILNVSRSTGPLPPGRALRSPSPPESAKIAISINANANLGIRMVPLHFVSQFVAAAGSANFQFASGIGCRAAELAASRSSAPISAYSLSRARHSWQSDKCAATSREIGSPSNSAETHSAASAQFISCSPLHRRKSARCAATPLAQQTISTSPCPPESAESPRALRTIALPLLSATRVTAALQPGAQMHLQSLKNSPSLPPLPPYALRLALRELGPVFSTTPQRASAQSRKRTSATTPAPAGSRSATATSA